MSFDSFFLCLIMAKALAQRAQRATAVVTMAEVVSSPEPREPNEAFTVLRLSVKECEAWLSVS